MRGLGVALIALVASLVLGGRAEAQMNPCCDGYYHYNYGGVENTNGPGDDICTVSAHVGISCFDTGGSAPCKFKVFRTIWYYDGTANQWVQSALDPVDLEKTLDCGEGNYTSPVEWLIWANGYGGLSEGVNYSFRWTLKWDDDCDNDFDQNDTTMAQDEYAIHDP